MPVPPSAAPLCSPPAAAPAPPTSSAAGSASAGAPTSDAGAAAAGGEVSFGSNASDELPKKVVQALADAFKTTSGTTVKINTLDHNTFQENINNYLQGKPDDVFTWFAGYRMRFFAAKGLTGDVSDVWSKLHRLQRRLQGRLDR